MKLSPWHYFRQKAAHKPQRILLAEGEDPRVIQAARTLHTEKIAQPFLVGSRANVERLWKQAGGRSLDVPCLDPKKLSASEKKTWANEWLSLSRNKNQSLEEAVSHIEDPLIFGCLYLKKGHVDGFV